MAVKNDQDRAGSPGIQQTADSAGDLLLIPRAQLEKLERVRERLNELSEETKDPFWPTALRPLTADIWAVTHKNYPKVK